MNKYYSIDRFTFYEDSIICHNEPLNYSRQAPSQYTKTALKDSEKYKGYLSDNAKRKIHQRITSWATAINVYNSIQYSKYQRKEHKPVFLTLTLSGKTELNHKEIKRKLLQQFLKRLIYEGIVTENFWKAELQNNGNIHFHIVIDKWIDKKKAQAIWNDIQGKNGLIKEFKKKYGHDNPPSTHVKGIDDLNKGVNYVMKYVSKIEDNGIIEGSVYRFSKGLTELKPFSISDSQVSMKGFNDWLKRYAKLDYSGDYFTKFTIPDKKIIDTIPPQILESYRDYYLDIYSGLYLNSSRPAPPSGKLLN
jgi:hypothetical protein